MRGLAKISKYPEISNPMAKEADAQGCERQNTDEVGIVGIKRQQSLTLFGSGWKNAQERLEQRLAGTLDIEGWRRV
jgi:hypothetical protein